LWAFFIFRGLFYCVAMPMWEGFDEPYQFAAVQYVALHGEMPTPATPLSRQVAASLYLSPAPWMLRLHQLPKPVLTYEAYWALPAEQRSQLRSELLSLPQSWASAASDPAIANYEGQQAPLYYFIAAPVLRAVAHLTLPGQVLALRLSGLFLASAAVPLGYLFARRAFNDGGMAILATALVVAMPELFVNLCRVSNETLALLLGTSLLLLSAEFLQSARPWVYAPTLGLTFALALLTKAYFLALLPALIVLFWLRFPPARDGMRLLTSLGIAFAIVALLAGPWYLHVHRMTGSWSGQMDDAATSHVSHWALLGQVIHVNWRSGFASILLSHIWFGGWSFLRFPAWTYIVVLLPAFGAGIGVCVYLVKWFRSERAPDSVIAVAGFYLCFWAGLCYHVLVTYIHLGVSASTGWYLYCLVFAEAVLVVQGLGQLLGRRRLLWLVPCGVSLFALIDLYGLHALMLPYYAGLIAHAGERVPPLAMKAFRAAEIFPRLSLSGTLWIHSEVLEFAWALYWLATLSSAFVAWWLLISSKGGRSRPVAAARH